MAEGLRYFSTFSGIGGFERGINQAYELQQLGTKSTDSTDATSATSQHAERPFCVGYSEIDKYATKVYERHYPNVRNYGDITKINAKELPDFDCLVGGFPCQAFSIAGKRRGFEDTRGTLFFDLARILREKQPRYFVFENVKGLLSHDQGNTFRTIITAIDELGYDCQWQVLNSKDFGVPQNRERVYIVGHLRGTPRPEVFPITGTNETRIKEPPTIIGSSQRHAKVSTDGISPTLSSAMGMGGGQTPMVSKTVRTSGLKSPHGSKQNWDSYEVNGRIRRLTPLECERLQGFPDGWTAEGIDGAISDTQRYKMCGNAVTTNVVQVVFERILNG